jgi:hypothetical protein
VTTTEPDASAAVHADGTADTSADPAGRVITATGFVRVAVPVFVHVAE